VAFFIRKIWQGCLFDQTQRVFVVAALLYEHASIVQKCSTF
jgi:hypothetical protein